MNFHIFTCILHLLRVYYALTKWPAPSDLMIAQLVEHCTGIAEVMGSRSGLNFFFRLYFHNCLSCVHNCNDQSYLHSSIFQV